MAANVEQPSLGLEKLFKRAKRFYHSQSKSNGEYLSAATNPNINGVSKEAQKTPAELSGSAVSKSLAESDRKSSSEPNSQTTSTSNKNRDSTKRSKSKDVNDILVPEAARPEIRSVNGSLEGVKNSEILKNYELSKSLNSDKLTEIINNSIKAAVQNLANDTNPVCWKPEKEREIVAPIESTCYNDTCPQRLKSTQNKENVTTFTQYSEQAVSSVCRPMLTSNICGIYGNNGSSGRYSKRSYNSHQLRSLPRQPPTCCIPSSKSGTISSVICHQSVSKYKQIACPYATMQPDKPRDSSSKSCKPGKPCKPCRHGKTDNRKMTGNVNIYICSEGNDGGTNKKKTESTCNSRTVTNASCACSSTDVCACQSTASTKTIRNLMETRKKSEDVTFKCLCGKLASDCECFPVQSKIIEGEKLCLCDMSSLNPTTSNETCKDPLDYNLQTPNNSDFSPQGDYCARRVRSRSSSRRESCCNRQNCDTFTGGAKLENSYADKLKFSTGNSGRGDAVQECSCCETFSNYSDGKFNACSCCDVNEVAKSSPRNQRERYLPQSNVEYPRIMDNPCDCCSDNNGTLYSSGRNKNESKQPRGRPPRKDYCTKPCDARRGSVRESNNQQRSRYSDLCIMEEDETCDASSCKAAATTKQENLSSMNSFRDDSTKFFRRESNGNQGRTDSNEQRSPSINDNKKRDDARKVVDDGVQTSQTVDNSTRMSVVEVVKSYSNADKSTSSNYISFTTAAPASPSVSKSKPVVQTKTSPFKEPGKSSLKWPFSKTKKLISSKNGSAESKKEKSPTNVPSAVPKPQVDTPPTVPKTNVSATNGVSKISEQVIEKSRNGVNSVSVTKNTDGENSSSASKESAKKNSLFVIKSSDTGGDKSKESMTENKTKLSSSKLGTLIADRKNSVQSAANNEPAQSYTDNEFSGPCHCGAKDADMCTCQYPQCPRCVRPKEDCQCNDRKGRPKDQSCYDCKQAKRLCCCCNLSNQQKSYRSVPEDGGFRVCTLCCRPEKNCCCNSTSQTSRRSRSPSISSYKSAAPYGLVGRKSQICLYCDEPRGKCSCRAPIKKCSYCRMPTDVCNCQEVTASCNACSYNENICQCNGRVVKNCDGGDQSICVTAWKPRRDVRKYFSRNPGERDKPDCSCCDSVRPYGSDELPYQRLSVFSDVMTELQQKMSEVTCCNRCGKTPCCCYLQESKSYSSPANESRVCNTMQRKSRSRSPPCRQCLGASPCKCGGRKASSYQICNRCRTAPCRCRKSRSIQRKPQAKCYYCKNSPCRCETSKPTTPKSCKCSGSPVRSQGQAGSSTPERHSPGPRPRSCCCRCASLSRGSPTRGQERVCA